jgi:hypothetical protein
MHMQKNRLLYVLLSFLILTSTNAQEKRLDYRQEQSLKDAKYYLDQSEGMIQQLDEKSKGWKVGDATVQIQDVQNVIRNLDRVKQYITNTDNRFKELPAENSKVKPEAERLAKLRKSYEATRKHAEEVEKGLKGVVQKGSGAGYQADFKRLKEITQMFGNPQIFNTYPDGAIEIAKQIKPVKAERKRIAEKYADLLKQSTGEAEQMNSVLNYFDEQFGNFEKAANQYASEAPDEIAQAIDENVKTAKEAAAEKKLGFFGPYGGINSTFKQTEVRYNILAALQPDSPQTAAARKKIDDGYVQVKQVRASLDQELLATNRVPDDQYNGPEKQQMLDAVKAKWSESGVAGDVLKCGINSSDWKRDTYWRFDGTDTFYKTDRSKAQGFVVVKIDNKTATIYYINLTKDHLSNDKIEAFYFDDPKAEADVTRKILLNNVK